MAGRIKSMNTTHQHETPTPQPGTVHVAEDIEVHIPDEDPYMWVDPTS